DLNLLISKMDVLVTSRFHGMIAALSAKVVPDVIGWSHKYEEIMKGYGIADLSISHKSLTYEMLETLVFGTIRNLDRYKRSIEANYQKMQDSSLGNMKIIDKELAAVQKKNKFYLGDFKDCFAGFSLDAGLRERAASGGMVTAYLSYLFDIGAISSALVSRMESKDGKLQAVPFFAQSKEELLGAQSSIYFDFPLEHSFRTIKEQKGKVAVVALPQQLKILDAMMGTDAELSKKVYRKIGLFCGHASEKRLLEAVLESKGITESAIEKFYFRQGRWRGTSRVELRSGEVVEFPYNDFGTLQNLYLHCPKRCHFCHDHYAEHADISFGDIWLKSFKKKEVKHSLIIARTQESLQDLYSMKQAQLVHLQGLPPKKAIAAQKRALIYHKHTVNALKRLQKTGVPIAKPRWNDYVAAGIILFNGKISRSPRAMKLLMHLPRPVLRAYMFVEKFFMNF
ncbi:MAG: Coenzyme F420 hydrogenase/dehydrogenase, beta subunit C-terminal domain, partial [Nanoarchaeota archaeon]